MRLSKCFYLFCKSYAYKVSTVAKFDKLKRSNLSLLLSQYTFHAYIVHTFFSTFTYVLLKIEINVFTCMYIYLSIYLSFIPLGYDYIKSSIRFVDVMHLDKQPPPPLYLTICRTRSFTEGEIVFFLC